MHSSLKFHVNLYTSGLDTKYLFVDRTTCIYDLGSVVAVVKLGVRATLPVNVNEWPRGLSAQEPVVIYNGNQVTGP